MPGSPVPGSPAPEETQHARQLPLLQGFGEPRPNLGKSATAASLPVARVVLESGVPHLDRLFDYTVPQDLAERAQPGVRVRVRFGGQTLNGFLLERVQESAADARLLPLEKVVSEQPVLTPRTIDLCRAVAERTAGTLSDVLRLAVPPRAVRVEREFQPGGAQRGSSGAVRPETTGGAPNPGLWARYRDGAEFLARLAAGSAPRAALASLAGHGSDTWAEEIAEAVAVCRDSGRGSLVVVPDQRDLNLLDQALRHRIGDGNFVRLHAEDGPTPRYRSFLSLLHGRANVAIGTRSAAYAPVADLGLAVIWDDGDSLHAEQRAPYQHAREVLLLRAEREHCALLLAGVTRSTDVQRLVEAGWVRSIQAQRSIVRARVPRVINASDSHQQARDPLAAAARLPHIAWLTAREALTRGPVLVQVARTGFSPAVACQDCRTPARCRECHGPLGQPARSAPLTCRWCSHLWPDWRCDSCGGHRIRAAAIGAARTVEELGRAFPATPVIASTGEHIRDTVTDAPALVVATPGAEPVAPAGYAAALLLDGTALLSRQGLRTPEDTLRRWFNAASLVRPAGDGGTVVVTVDDAAADALVRWDPVGAAERELALRRELGLPPAVRLVSLTGPAAALAQFLQGVDLPPSVRVAGPAPLEEGQGGPDVFAAEDHRALLFVPYAEASAVVRAVRARRSALSAQRSAGLINVRCDPWDVL